MNSQDLAAIPATIATVAKKETALVSAKVTSHTRQRPSRHGINERPSGRLQSTRKSLCDFLVAWMLARFNEQCIMQFC